jgi:glycosyltransferase involved in cell wall biosynthesis
MYKQRAGRFFSGVKIAIVTETFPPEINGVAMTFGILAREMTALGHSVTVYRPSQPHDSLLGGAGDYRQQAMAGIPLPGYPSLRVGLPAKSRLERFWRDVPPDVVHVVTEGPLGVSAVSAALELGIPVTSSFHTNFHSYMSHYGLRIFHGVAMAWLRRIHNRTVRTFVPTEEIRQQLETNGFQNLALLSRGVDTRVFDPALRCDALRSSWGANPETCVVLHAGRLAPEKNYPLLLEAFRRMRAANSGCRFVMVGDGPLRMELQRECGDCHFVGAVPHERMGVYYASADVYLHASRTETFGNVVLEALASGLAFAGFDYAAARRFVQNGRNGLLADREQSDDLLDAAVALVADSDLRHRLRTGARLAVESQSWRAVAAQFARELEEVAEKGC